MSSPFIGEIRIFAGNFPPAGWAFCDGQLLSIAENDALFNLIGTTYGGDGQSTFALPDLRGRVPIHMGQGAGLSTRTIGESGGTEVETLTANQITAHTHVPQAGANNGSATTPTGNVWAASTDLSQFNASPDTNMNAGTITSAGGSQPHNNMLPFLGVNFIISLFGVYPSQA